MITWRECVARRTLIDHSYWWRSRTCCSLHRQ